MQITNDQFTAAMQTAVVKRGSDWRYPEFNAQSRSEGYYTGASGPFGASPTYFNAQGEATCLIGAALAELNLSHMATRGNVSANSLLNGATSVAVALAARCGQIHQDGRNSWGDSLNVYLHALEIAEETGRTSVYDIAPVYHEATRRANGMPEQEVKPMSHPITMEVPAALSKMIADIDAAVAKAKKDLDALAEAANEQIEAPKPVNNFPAVKAPKKDFAAGGVIDSVINLDEVYTWSGNSCFGGIWTEPIVSNKTKVLIGDLVTA